MQQCPKCATQYPDEAKICRVCGSILDAFAEPKVVPEPPLEPEEELVTMADLVEDSPSDEFDDYSFDETPSADSAENRPAWVCSHCQKIVPGNFDVCWNCFADESGQFDSDFSKNAAADRNENLAEVIMAETVAPRRQDSTCSRCGSNKIIRDAQVVDQGQHSNGSLQVVIYGDPDAMIFKDRRYGKLLADICGQCGHVELHIENPRGLYEHYRDAQR